jgi:lysophospholipase L1-like esterase
MLTPHPHRTYGFNSPDGNGYRYALRGKLIADGNDVNMVGAKSAGNMSNNQVEAWPGYRIGQVAAKATPSFYYMPNVVLIFLGTNDMTQNFEVSTAHERMGQLIDQIFDIAPNTTVIVSKLLPNGNPTAETNTLVFNSNLDLTVANLTSQGKKVSSVDMHSDWFSTADLGPDGTHPTETGYLKMARVFYTGIVEAARAGNISAPVAAKGADGGLIDDYAAGNDSQAAGTAMDVVCQTTNGGNESTTQKTQCNVSGASDGTVVNVSVLFRVREVVLTCDRYASCLAC